MSVETISVNRPFSCTLNCGFKRYLLYQDISIDQLHFSRKKFAGYVYPLWFMNNAGTHLICWMIFIFPFGHISLKNSWMVLALACNFICQHDGKIYFLLGSVLRQKAISIYFKYESSYTMCCCQQKRQCSILQ